MKKTGQNGSLLFLKFNFPILWRLRALLYFSFYLEEFKLEKKNRKPKCRLIGRKK